MRLTSAGLGFTIEETKLRRMKRRTKHVSFDVLRPCHDSYLSVEQGGSDERIDRANDEAARVAFHEMADDPDYVGSVRLRRRPQSASSVLRSATQKDGQDIVQATPTALASFKQRLSLTWRLFWDAESVLEGVYDLVSLLTDLSSNQFV
jgi:hypothetical protein